MGSFEARSGGEPQREKRREGQGGRVGCLSRACRQRGRCTPWHLLPPAPSFFWPFLPFSATWDSERRPVFRFSFFSCPGSPLCEPSEVPFFACADKRTHVSD